MLVTQNMHGGWVPQSLIEYQQLRVMMDPSNHFTMHDFRTCSSTHAISHCCGFTCHRARNV